MIRESYQKRSKNKKMSTDLQWALISKWNSFQRKRGCVTLSAEKYNLTNRHNKRSSGLISGKKMDISGAKDGKGVVVSTKLAGGRKRSLRSVSSTIKKGAGNRGYLRSVGRAVRSYHPKLAHAALARTCRVLRAQRVASGVLKTKNAPKAQPKTEKAPVATEEKK